MTKYMRFKKFDLDRIQAIETYDMLYRQHFLTLTHYFV